MACRPAASCKLSKDQSWDLAVDNSVRGEPRGPTKSAASFLPVGHRVPVAWEARGMPPQESG